jgi:hypothetical protein
MEKIPVRTQHSKAAGLRAGIHRPTLVFASLCFPRCLDLLRAGDSSLAINSMFYSSLNALKLQIKLGALLATIQAPVSQITMLFCMLSRPFSVSGGRLSPGVHCSNCICRKSDQRHFHSDLHYAKPQSPQVPQITVKIPSLLMPGNLLFDRLIRINSIYWGE